MARTPKTERRATSDEGRVFFEVINWRKAQPKMPRGEAAWLKLYTSLLEHDGYASLDDRSARVLIGIWLLAAKTGEHILPADPEWLQRALHLPYEPDLAPLAECRDAWGRPQPFVRYVDGPGGKPAGDKGQPSKALGRPRTAKRRRGATGTGRRAKGHCACGAALKGRRRKCDACKAATAEAARARRRDREGSRTKPCAKPNEAERSRTKTRAKPDEAGRNRPKTGSGGLIRSEIKEEREERREREEKKTRTLTGSGKREEEEKRVAQTQETAEARTTEPEQPENPTPSEAGSVRLRWPGPAPASFRGGEPVPLGSIIPLHQIDREAEAFGWAVVAALGLPGGPDDQQVRSEWGSFASWWCRVQSQWGGPAAELWHVAIVKAEHIRRRGSGARKPGAVWHHIMRGVLAKGPRSPPAACG